MIAFINEGCHFLEKVPTKGLESLLATPTEVLESLLAILSKGLKFRGSWWRFGGSRRIGHSNFRLEGNIFCSFVDFVDLLTLMFPGGLARLSD